MAVDGDVAEPGDPTVRFVSEQIIEAELRGLECFVDRGEDFDLPAVAARWYFAPSLLRLALLVVPSPPC